MLNAYRADVELGVLPQETTGVVVENLYRLLQRMPPATELEHALLQGIGRVKYISARDDEALDALEELCELEGILTALETSHAFAAAREWAKENPGKRILIGNSGRGDKDMPTLTKFPAKVHSHAST